MPAAWHVDGLGGNPAKSGFLGLPRWMSRGRPFPGGCACLGAGFDLLPDLLDFRREWGQHRRPARASGRSSAW